MNAETVSKLRLRGQPCPDDLVLLIEKCSDLLEELGVSIPTEGSWSPWKDKSYLTTADLKDPDIAGNVRALEEVCEMVSFVAETDGGEFIGYWRGPDDLPIREAALVYYDTEGMFYLCGSRFVDALFVLYSGHREFQQLKNRLKENGIDLNYLDEDDVPIPSMDFTPEAVHNEKFERYRLESDL
jgi:hypothetical protein